jgi:hypothetical protein
VHRPAWALPVVVAVVLLAASIAFVAVVGFRPSFDPYGWLVWGHQTLHGHLDTDAAPSWKPLTFIFTVPYALFGHTAVWLWTVTAVAGTLGGAVFAARIAYRLTGAGAEQAQRRWAPYVAGGVAGIGVLGINTYSHWTLIANADPLNVTLLLAAIDAHLSRRPRLAFAVLVLAALGRPEVWPFAGLYAVWLWVREPSARPWALLGLVLIAAAWFVVPGLTSKSWLRPGDLALNQGTVIHGTKIVGVFDRWRSLYEPPMQIAAALGVLLAAVRRDATTLGLAACAALWVIVEIAFAYHGWSAVSRYLLEPAAVMVVVAGGFVGRLLSDTSGRGFAVGLLGPALVLVLLATLVPAALDRERTWHAQISRARDDAKVIDGLSTVVARVGGGRRILRCGQAVSYNRLQSTVAWTIGVNVGKVGYNVAKSIARGDPIVVLTPQRQGWRVRPYNQTGVAAAACAHLGVDSPSG